MPFQKGADAFEGGVPFRCTVALDRQKERPHAEEAEHLAGLGPTPSSNPVKPRQRTPNFDAPSASRFRNVARPKRRPWMTAPLEARLHAAYTPSDPRPTSMPSAASSPKSHGSARVRPTP
jgi:hypothetical protein